MAKQLNVNMAFTANTSQAKREVQNLQNTLNNLMGHKFDINIDADKIHNAITATAELSAHLQKATNIDTGNLDFSKLSQSLKSSGKTLMDYGKSLQQLGPEGQKAFMQLTAAVAQAEVPIRRTHTLVKEFATTLANTARWQISSSVLHGFMGALQSAYGYAQDLNESLNNIRIVTGQSIDEMADFAKEANKAAKALSATTTEYTNASLIYYQQGLSDAEVKKRADVTVKLANVSRQSSETVSGQMTAVWNNFYDGSKSLEYYADVMTALGATTASSTEEIAGGLEKFAAVADTIGLSYEYAASALATITSNTRQSEEVVGTALKTIFARIQGLNLGETLDDGTTLNKYSQAMAKVGINILDASGNLKDMDNILNEMGNKWDNISKAQQVALAQTVAGTRQYNQLIALMDNWNSGDGDSFMANLATATGSSGALQEQADIYAESWEAAADRVQTAAEAIYDKLINDEFFINLLNNVEKLLEFINNLIDGLGGLRGVLFALGTIVTKVFSQQMSQGLTNLAYNLQMITESGRKKIRKEKSDFIAEAASNMAKNADVGEVGYDQQIAAKLYEQQLTRQQELIDNADKMSEIELETTKRLMDQLKLRDELAIKSAAELQQRKDALANSASLIYARGAETAATQHRKYSPALITDEMTKIKAGITGATELQNLFTSGENIDQDSIIKIFKKINGDTTKGWNIVSASQIHQIKELSEGLEMLDKDTDAYQEKIHAISGLMERVNEKIQQHASDITGATAAEIKNYAENVDEVSKAVANNNKIIEESKKTNDNLKKTISEAKGAQKSWSDTFIESVNAATSLASALSMIGGIWDTLQDPELSGWQKFITVLTTLGMLIPSIMMAFNSLDAVFNHNLTTMLSSIKATTIHNAILQKQLTIEKQQHILKQLINGASVDSIANHLAELAIKKNLIKEEEKENYILGLKTKIKSLEILNSVKNTITKATESLSIKAKSIADQTETASIWAKVSAYIAAQAAAFPVLAVTLLIVAAMATLAATIAAVVGVVKALTNAYNKDTIAAEQAKNTAKDLAETYQNTKQAYEDMIAAMSNYDTAKKSLEELTKGTEEYNKALQEANRAALELVNNYPEYFGEGSYKWENGQLILDEEAMANAQQQMAMKESAAYSAAQMGAAEAKHARTQADLTQLARDITPGDATGAAVTTGIVTALLGGPGSPLGLLALKIGGLTTTIMGVAEDSRKNAIELAAQELQNNENLFDILAQQNTVEGLKEALGTDDNELVMALLSNRDALLENKDSIIELSKNMEAADQAEKLAAQQSFMEVMKATSYSTDKNADRMAYLGGAAYQEAQTEAYDRLLDEMSNKSKLKNYSSDYFDKMGLSSQDGFKVGKYDAKKGIVSYSYTDENGDTQEKEVSAMEIAQTLAVSEAMSSVTSSCQVLSEAFAKLDHDASATSEAMKEFLSTGDTSSLTKEQYDAMASMSEGELIKYLEGLGINEDVVKSMGYDNLSGMVDDMDLDSTGDKWAKYENITSMQGTGGLTLAQAENISSATNALGDFYGTDMANEMTGMMDTTSQTLDADTQAAFWSQLGNIEDYTDAQAWDDFLANMAEATDLTADEAAALEGFAKSASLAANATKELNFEDLKKNVQGLQDIVKSVSSGNRNISDEQMETLKDQGIDTSKFAKTLNGWRYFGDTGEMVSDISNSVHSQFKNVEQNFINIAEEAAQAKKNMAAAEKALKEAKIAGDKQRAIEEQTARDSISAADILREMMSHIVDVVTIKIKSAWDWICETLISIYDFFVGIFNSMGEGISSAWNSFVGWLEQFINGIKSALKEVLSVLGVDVSKWEDVKLAKMNFTPQKTSDELKAEQEVAKAASALAESTAKIIEATPGLIDSIQASADYYTEDELATQQKEVQSKRNDAGALQKLYAEKYGEDSEMAKYYQALVDSYNAQIEAYDKAIQSRQALIADIKETERYDDLEKSIAKLNNELEKTDALKELAFGADKLSYIKEETSLLKDLIKKEKEYQTTIADDLGSQRTSLNTKWGIEFDDDGNISNYDNVMYNHAGNWEAVKADIEKYEQTQDKQVTSTQTLLDYTIQLKEKNLEAYETADEALSKYTEKLSHHNNVLEHYKNLSALIGKENDYKSMGEILKGQASVLSNSYKASEKNYQMYQDEVTRWEELMGSTSDTDLLAIYTKNWEDAQAKSREAQDEMLSDLQTWAESEKAILDNTLADLGHSLETTLTGGQTFDELSTQMERAQSLQEEYLTTTNQIYETTKMMRTAQQAIDTSSNVVAKEKLKNFITETKSLQEQGKLSRYELDMQQAKYDLLVAEIALEEAQNAKSTVRLQRDAEGNFGYVYTADSNAVNDAQQQYDDAENALYNKGLEGANDYSQKSQQTMQEMVEALKTIQTNYQNGMYSSEQEYETAMLEVKEHYLQKLQDYSMLYNTAIGADSRVMAEAWSSSFADMTLDAENWDSAVEDYISGAKNAFNDWSDVVATIKETTGSDLTDLANKVSNVTTASNELATALFGTEGGDGGIFGRLKEGLAEVVTAIQNALNGGTTPGANGAATASGGLTSNWGPAGKMLMVHESELILNKDQTNKFFDNLAIMESILSTIDSYALGQQFGGMLQSPAYGSTSSGTLEQSVHIEASFPSVTDRNEIEEAFNNLVNKASQYANRK